MRPRPSRSWILVGLALLGACKSTRVVPDGRARPPSPARVDPTSSSTGKGLPAPAPLSVLPSSIRAPRGAWYGVYLGTRKIGWANITLRRTRFQGAPARALRTRMQMRAAFGSMQADMWQEGTRYYEVSGAARLTGVRSRMRQGPLESEIDVRRQGDRMIAIRRVAGREERREIPASRETFRDALFGGEVAGSARAGDVLRGHVFFEETLTDIPVSTRILSSGLERVGGVRIELVRARVEGLPMGLRMEASVAPPGELVVGTMGPITLRLEGESAARAPHVRSDLLDLSPPVAPLADREKDSVTLRVWGLPPELARNDERQRFERLDDGSYRVTLRRLGRPKSRARRPVTDPAFVPFLKATTVLQSDHAEIRAAAAEAVGAESDAWRAALRLREWVHRRIRPSWRRTLDALSALRAGSGMCYESAHVLAATARAAGIPSRLAYGLVYAEIGGGARFVGHAWTELWVGAWVPFDATERRGPAIGPHLKLAGEGEEGKAVEAVGKLRLEWVRDG